MPPVGDASRLWLPTVGNRAGGGAAISRVRRSDMAWTDQRSVRNRRASLPAKSSDGLRNQPIGHRDSRSQSAAL